MLNKNGLCLLQATDLKTCMNCPLKRHSLFSDLSFSELEILNQNRYESSYKAGDTIFKEGQRPYGLICLNDGKVKISRQGINGVEQIVSLKKPVNFIGFRSLMSGRHYKTSAVALEDSSVCIIEKSAFFKVISNNSQFSFKLIRFFANEIERIENRLLNLNQKHLRARLADALLFVNEVYGTCPVKQSINVALKRSDLAALSNMTTANAIRVLSSFSKENIAEVNYRNICLKDIKALREISDFGR